MSAKPKIKVSVESFEKQPEPQPEEEQEVQVKRKKKIKKKKRKSRQVEEEEEAIAADEIEEQPQVEVEPKPEAQEESQPIQAQEAAQAPPQKVKLGHLAVCIPDSLVSIPQSSVIRSYFLSELARICSLYRVDEIIVLHDYTYESKSDQFNPSEYMIRNFQYLETPQYLRKHLFEMHSDLKNAGLMNPIECDHHLKADEILEFREGVVIDRPVKSGSGSWVEIGLKQQAKIDYLLPPKTRVTLRLNNYQDPSPKFYEAEAVSRTQPKLEQNLYWGYTIRAARNLKHVFKGQQPYTKTILVNHRPTSESTGLAQFSSMQQAGLVDDDRVLLFYSGYESLQDMVGSDEACKIPLKELLGMFDGSFLFHKYGVKQLRIEQQLTITLNQLFEFTN